MCQAGRAIHQHNEEGESSDAAALQQLHELDERIAAYDRRVNHVCTSDERSAKLTTLPGIGPLTATAVIAAINDGNSNRYI